MQRELEISITEICVICHRLSLLAAGHYCTECGAHYCLPFCGTAENCDDCLRSLRKQP